jgi:hypothetical protein
VVVAAGSGAGEAVGVGAGLDDVAAEGEAIDDGRGYLDFSLRIVLMTCVVVLWATVFD